MTLAQLQDAELYALVAALWHLSALDGTLSAEEIEGFAVLASEAGPRRFFTALERARAEVDGEDALAGALAAVERPAARELVFATLTDLAATDGISGDEAAFLERVRTRWSLAEVEPMRLALDPDRVDVDGMSAT